MKFNKILNEVRGNRLNEASITMIKNLISKPDSFNRALTATSKGDWSLLKSGINDEGGEPMSSVQAFEEIASYIKANKNKFEKEISLTSVQKLINNLTDRGGEKAITDEMVKRWSKVIWGSTQA